MKKQISLFIFFTTLVSLYTLAPSDISPGTSSVATTIAATSGILNPPGYPLFGFFADITQLLPFKLSLALKINLVSVFSGALFLSLFFFFLSTLLEKVNETKKFSILISSLTSLTLFLTPAFQSQFTVAEKYPFVYLSFILLLLFNLKIFTKEKDKSISLYFHSFTCGVSICAHYILLPLAGLSLASVIFCSHRSFKKILASIISFILGLSFFAYLPFKALKNPLMNWGELISIENFLAHVLREQYMGLQVQRTWEIWLYQWNLQYQFLFEQIGYVHFISAFVGLFFLFKKNWKWGISGLSLLLLFGECITYFVQFYHPSGINIHDHIFDRMMWPFYFILALLYLALATLAYSKILNNFHQKWLRPVLVILIFLASPLKWPQEPSPILKEFRFNIDQSISQQALIITNIDSLFFPLTFYQLNEKWRPQTPVIHTALMRATWYQNHLKQIYPTFYKDHQVLLDEYFSLLREFHASNNIDPAAMNNSYLTTLHQIAALEEKKNKDILLMRNDFITTPYRGLFQSFSSIPSLVGDKIYAQAGEVKPFKKYSQMNFEETSRQPSPQTLAWTQAIRAYYSTQIRKRQRYSKILSLEEEEDLDSILKQLFKKEPHP